MGIFYNVMCMLVCNVMCVHVWCGVWDQSRCLMLCFMNVKQVRSGQVRSGKQVSHDLGI